MFHFLLKNEIQNRIYKYVLYVLYVLSYISYNKRAQYTYSFLVFFFF